MIARASESTVREFGPYAPSPGAQDAGGNTVPAAPKSPLDDEVFPHQTDAIPPGVTVAGAYELRFAWTRRDLADVQSLRYRVFNQELGEGLATAVSLARDEDHRDPWFHHLMIIHRTSGEVVGTYRMQTVTMAASRFGFYSAEFFELGGIPSRILAHSVEIGRACVAPAHRNGRVIRLLWRGLARYLQWNGQRYLFGCCSVAGLDADLARTTWNSLSSKGALHNDVFVRPRSTTRALHDDGRTLDAEAPESSHALPPLFQAYLALGARVCGPPAFDREFGTTDYLVLLDTEAMEPTAYASFFG
jgi:hypothetical protein